MSEQRRARELDESFALLASRTFWQGACALLGVVAFIAMVVLLLDVRSDAAQAYGTLAGFVFLGALIGVVALRKPTA